MRTGRVTGQRHELVNVVEVGLQLMFCRGIWDDDRRGDRTRRNRLLLVERTQPREARITSVVQVQHADVIERAHFAAEGEEWRGVVRHRLVRPRREVQVM